jgi:nucleosome assembly protein 1-like 1
MSNKKVTEGVKNISLEGQGEQSAVTPFQFNFSQPASQADSGADKGQLGKIDKEKFTQEFIAKLPASVQTRVKTLQALQKENSALLRKRDEEIKQIVLKYELLQEPQFTQRKGIVTGNHETSTDGVLGVPEFWLSALKNHPEMAETVTEADEEALKYLQDITTYTLTDKNGFGLSFYFAENPFFTDAVLTKKYLMDENDDDLENVEGCKINWKEGKNLTVKLVKKKKGKGAKAKVVKKEEPIDSFFRFFAPPDLDLVSEDQQEEIDINEIVEADYELGSIVRQIVLSAVDWYTGEATLDLLDGDDDEDDEDDEDDDDEDDDEDEDDEEEDDEPVRGKGKGGSKGKPQAGKAKNAQQQEECKQQ